MRRRAFVRRSVAAGVAAGGVGAAGCLTGSDGNRFQDGFEDELGDWSTAAAIGPEVDVAEFEWEIGVSTEEAAAGDQSLRVWNEGDYDDGTCWAVHPVPVESGRAYEVEVSAQWWSLSESFNTLRNVVMRIGPDRPSVEEDFPEPGVNTSDLGETPYGGLREPLHLAEGWREYAFEWTTPTLSTGTLHLAVGTSVVWESEATHYVDDVSVEVSER